MKNKFWTVAIVKGVAVDAWDFTKNVSPVNGATGWMQEVYPNAVIEIADQRPELSKIVPAA